jgi:hypothetical protein
MYITDRSGMKLWYSYEKNELCVGDQTLREFYIETRKDAGIKIARLEMDSGLNHGTLYYVEHPYARSGKYSKSAEAILRALETMGVSLNLEG